MPYAWFCSFVTHRLNSFYYIIRLGRSNVNPLFSLLQEFLDCLPCYRYLGPCFCLCNPIDFLHPGFRDSDKEDLRLLFTHFFLLYRLMDGLRADRSFGNRIAVGSGQFSHHALFPYMYCAFTAWIECGSIDWSKCRHHARWHSSSVSLLAHFFCFSQKAKG